MSRILFVFTSTSKTPTGRPTGWFLPEAAHPYYALSSHYDIDFAASGGPNPPADPVSVEEYTDEDSTRFLVDPVVKHLLENAKKLDTVKADDYQAIYYVGGLGPTTDLVGNKANTTLAENFYHSGKLIAVVCHAAAAIIDVKGLDGKSIFDGRTVTAFSNEEMELFDGIKDVPFLIEDEIKRLGGKYVKADEPLGVKVVRDGNFISGQNPNSARLLGEEILKFLQEKV
ncbi:class I glutamine amidotransferase-like protein [Amylostereum chailletii]|nr:class I glutamine amidotransferase-like protein [Amylostereum chailletii]